MKIDMVFFFLKVKSKRLPELYARNEQASGIHSFELKSFFSKNLIISLNHQHSHEVVVDFFHLINIFISHKLAKLLFIFENFPFGLHFLPVFYFSEL